jgi:hypothetical protein
MTPTNRLSHNVFRTVAYTKKKWLRSNFFDRNILKTLMSLMTYLSRYRCRYLLTALGFLSSTFRLCQQQLREKICIQLQYKMVNTCRCNVVYKFR